jgi:hypothetical protein
MPAAPEGPWSRAHAHFKVLIFQIEKVVNQIAATTAQAVPDGTFNPALVYQDTERAPVFEPAPFVSFSKNRGYWIF